MAASETYHPELDIKTMRTLDLVRQLMAENSSFFLDSHYSSEQERLLRSWFAPEVLTSKRKQAEDVAENGTNPHTLESNKAGYLYHETKTLFENLKSAKYSQSMEGDEMSYFRTMTALSEKLISYQERALNMKSISEGYNAILRIMESVLSADQRNAVMEQLRQVLEGE